MGCKIGRSDYSCLARTISRTFFIVAGDAGVSVGSDLGGRRAVFLSVHGVGRGEGEAGPETSGLNLGLFLGYVVPLTCQGSIDKDTAFRHLSLCAAESLVVDGFPSSPQYPRFYPLSVLLRGMVAEDINIHPLTREMLSALDQ